MGRILLAALGLAGYILSGCATTQAFKPVNTVEGLVGGNPASITILDRNNDKKYDMIVYKVGNQLIADLCFVDEDFNETFDLVVRGVSDAEGNPDLDGTYKGMVNYEDYFEEVMGRKPTEEEKTVDGIHRLLLKGLE